MSYQDPYQPGYGQQPGQDPSGYPQQPYSGGPTGQDPYQQQQYSGGPSYPVTPGPAYAPQPAYQVQPVYAQPVIVASAPTNTMAVLSLVFAFVFTPLGVVFGHIARGQIKRTGEQGDGLALAGLIISYISLGIGLTCCVVFFVLPVLGLAVFGGTTSTDPNYGYYFHLAANLLQLVRA